MVFLPHPGDIDRDLGRSPFFPLASFWGDSCRGSLSLSLVESRNTDVHYIYVSHYPEVLVIPIGSVVGVVMASTEKNVISAYWLSRIISEGVSRQDN